MERFKLHVSTCLWFTALALTGCGAPAALDATGSDDLSQFLSAQSLTHGTAHAASATRLYFSGRAGDTLNPDVWPTGGAANSLLPTLQLFAPADSSGSRELLAQATPVDVDPTHLSLQLVLPRSGTYLFELGAQSGHEGAFSLRLWTSASHAPRAEAMQVSLELHPSDAVEAALVPHEYGGSRNGVAWSSDEVDALTALVRAESDPRAAISDCALLYSTLAAAHASGLATDALVEKAEHAGADLLGDPAAFSALPANERVLAFSALGLVQPAVFKTAAVSDSADTTAARAAIDQRISALVAGWRGSLEVSSARKLVSLSRDGTVYGYAADWQALQLDSDGKTQVFSWQSSDYFGADGSWLGESSLGALEPDDE